MKHLILTAIALIGIACSSQSQIVNFLGYDTTNGRVIYEGTNALTFTNPLQFESGVRAATRTNLGLGVTNNVEFRRLKMIAADAADDGDNATLWLDTSGTNKAAAMRLSGTGGGAEKYNAYLQAGSFGLQASAGGGFRVLSGPTAGVGSVLFAVNSSGNATLNGVNNTAPSQTASSGSSLMTRGLGDTRYGGPVLLSKLTSDVSYTNNSTGTTILSVTFPSDGAYEVNQLVRFTANGANSKVSLSGSSAGTALTGYRESYNNGSSPTRIVGLKNPVGTGGSFGDTANADNHGRHGVIMAFTGATLQITAAQNTNSTNVTTVGSGSYLSVRQLSADTAW